MEGSRSAACGHEGAVSGLCIRPNKRMPLRVKCECQRAAVYSYHSNTAIAQRAPTCCWLKARARMAFLPA